MSRWTDMIHMYCLSDSIRCCSCAGASALGRAVRYAGRFHNAAAALIVGDFFRSADAGYVFTVADTYSVFDMITGSTCNTGT